MPKVHFVKKARKDNPAVKAGESYFWWKFMFGGKRYSKTPPRRSQLTQSDFLSQMYDLEDNLGDRFAELADQDGIQSELDNLLDELDTLMDECQDSLENMPYALQESSESGQLLQERINGLEEWISQIQDIECDIGMEEVVNQIEDANPGTW